MTDNIDGARSTLQKVTEKQARDYMKLHQASELVTPGPGAYNVNGEGPSSSPRRDSVKRQDSKLQRQPSKSTLQRQQSNVPSIVEVSDSRPSTQ